MDTPNNKYKIVFYHHEFVRTEAIVEASNDVEALYFAFKKLISDGWNEKSDFSWVVNGAFSIQITTARQ